MSFSSVSVVIPCFNSGGTVGRAVESVYQQTLLPSEVILVDDCSLDDTLDELKAIQAKYPEGWVKVVSLPENVGAGSARNRGWDLATQDYIAFLDSDDSWDPRKIEVQYGWMLEHSEVALTGHARAVVDSESLCPCELRGLSSRPYFYRVSAFRLMLSNRFATSTVMLKRDLPFRFEEGKRHSEDYLLWLEIALAGNHCYRSSDELAFLYKEPYGASGLSGSLWRMELGQLDSYIKAYNKGLIGMLALLLLMLLSIAKYFRRICLVFLRRLSA